MSSIFSGFFSGSGSQDRVGSVRGGFYGNASPDYERLDGRSLVRESYPDLSPLFPFNKLVPTIRTLAGNGVASAFCVATANHFVTANSNSSGAAVQYSTDGASWSTATTPTATVALIIATAVRFIALCSSATQPLATTNLTPSSTWSATTSGPASVTVGNHISRLAYSSSLGRVLAVAATRFSLDDAATAWVGRTSTTGLAPVGTCWTGTRFVNIGANTALCEFSTDGITYTTGALLEATSTSQGNIASNGSGLVIVSGSPSGLQVSSDSGDTWRIVQIPGTAPSDTWRVQYASDRFVVPTTSGLAFSTNGDDWYLDTTPTQSMTVAVGVAKKGTTFVEILPSTTTAYSFTLSATDFLLPVIRSAMPVASGSPLAGPPMYIKAR